VLFWMSRDALPENFPENVTVFAAVAPAIAGLENSPTLTSATRTPKTRHLPLIRFFAM
jgi:hypothetical protein